MKSWFAVGLVLSLTAALVLAADDQPKPNALTEKEVADGWLLLFDGETTFGWQTTTSEKDKSLRAEDGALVLSGKGASATFVTPCQSFELEFEYRSDGANRPRFLVWHTTPAADHTPTNDMALPAHEKLRKEWGYVSFDVENGKFHYKVAPPREKPSTSGRLDAPKNRLATIQFQTDSTQEGKLYLRNVKLKPLDTKPLFNGKDLAGWKKYTSDDKRAKTEFSVSKQGWLQLKNGPGDLQTESQYADFLLQIECRSNGKHLNSGVFFRCIPIQYQQGYEAQIHNGWTDKPEKEYTIKKYDPKTNELKGEEKVKSAAMDYGTGAVYNRVPARRQVAKDNEWFTMTVAAQGRHIATWVNGVQVVDWTDNRPVKDNARNGCKLEKGAISLQGHDPTTDLSFRNIRIADLSTEKK